jgi:hypothetical protein
MKTSRILYTLLAVLPLLGSCRKPVDIIVATEPRLMLMCFPGASDTTVVQLFKGLPVGEPVKSLPFLESADISFTVNGTPKEVSHAYYGLGSVPAGCWFVTGEMLPGDVVEIRASAEGIPPVKASTVIPRSVEDINAETKVKNGLESLKLSFPDDPATRDFYGVQVLEEKTLEGETSQSAIAPYHKKMQPLGGRISTDAPYATIGFNGKYLSYKYMTDLNIEAWPDKYSTKDGRFDMTFKFKEEREEDEEEETPDGSSYRHKIRIYSLSEEFFRYVKSREALSGNEFTEMGLAPMAIPFSNVEGGFGILAGWSVTETGWITP